MTADKIRRLISSTQAALDVKEKLSVPKRSESERSAPPEIAPIRPPSGDWSYHDRWGGRDVGDQISADGEARPVEGELPAIPVEQIPTDGLLLEGPDDDLVSAIDEADAKNAEQPSILSSFDVAACYVPFHFTMRFWGIYIWKSGLIALVRDLVDQPRINHSQNWIVSFAWRALYLHELFHHWVEVAVARAQAPNVLGKMFKLSPDFGALYTDYFHDDPASAVEEALANAFVDIEIDRFFGPAFRFTAPFDEMKKRLRRVMSSQPWPYCDYKKFLSGGRHTNARSFLLDRAFLKRWITPGSFPKTPSPSDIFPSNMWFLGQRSDRAACPVYFVDDALTVPLDFAKPFPKRHGLQVLVYTRDHKPPHIHAIDLRTQEERRFTWQDLQPLDTKPLSPSERDVRTYCDEFRRKIDVKVKSVPWQ